MQIHTNIYIYNKKSKKLEIVHVFNCLIIKEEVEIKLGQIFWKKTEETTKGLIAQTWDLSQAMLVADYFNFRKEFYWWTQF